MPAILTRADLDRLVASPSAERRAETATRVAHMLDAPDLGPAERTMAEEIVRTFARDAEVRVRGALSEQLKSNPRLPRDLALALARDFDCVALPLLEFSVVFTAADLIAIVRDSGSAKQEAIARRSALAASVGDALAEHGTETAVATLLRNDSATLSEGAFATVVDRFPASPAVHAPLVHRAQLPIGIAERLITLVSEQLRSHLAIRHRLPPDIAAEIVQETRERATLSLAGGSAAAAVLADELFRHDRLTPTIAIRALCIGDIAFFEAAVACRAGIPVANARMLIHDSGEGGLRAICVRAGIPDAFLPVVRTAVDLIAELDHDGEPMDRERYRRRMIERLLTGGGALAPDDLAYLLRQLGRTTEPARAHAH